ncbi:MAG: hypothetical protein ACP5VR_06300 [Acidimicrobiales bacterium]
MAAVVLVAAALAGVAAAQPPAVPVPRASYTLNWQVVGCPSQHGRTAGGQQSVDGKVDVCLEVPDVPGGTYHLSVVDYLVQSAGKFTRATHPAASHAASPAVSLRAEPSSVQPASWSL